MKIEILILIDTREPHLNHSRPEGWWDSKIRECRNSKIQKFENPEMRRVQVPKIVFKNQCHKTASISLFFFSARSRAPWVDTKVLVDRMFTVTKQPTAPRQQQSWQAGVRRPVSSHNECAVRSSSSQRYDSQVPCSARHE